MNANNYYFMGYFTIWGRWITGAVKGRTNTTGLLFSVLPSPMCPAAVVDLRGAGTVDKTHTYAHQFLWFIPLSTRIKISKIEPSCKIKLLPKWTYETVSTLAVVCLHASAQFSNEVIDLSTSGSGESKLADIFYISCLWPPPVMCRSLA